MNNRGICRRHQNHIKLRVLFLIAMILVNSVHPAYLNAYAEEIEYTEENEPAVDADAENGTDGQVSIPEVFDDMSSGDVLISALEDTENNVDALNLTGEQADVLDPGDTNTEVEEQTETVNNDEIYTIDEDNQIQNDEFLEEEISVDTITGKDSNLEQIPEFITVSGLILDYYEISLEVGDSYTLSASILPEDSPNTRLYWSSLDESVASVADGMISALSSGKTTITVTTEDGGYKAECEVFVSEAEIEDKIDEELHAVVFDANGGAFEDGSETIERLVKLDEIVYCDLIPERDGYAFLGWVNEEGVIINDAITNHGEDIILCAKWEEELVLTAQSQVVENGTCGEGVTYELDEDGHLVIQGNGIIKEHPWDPDVIKNVDILEGVTGIGASVFSKCSGLKSINLPNSLTSIGNEAFYMCSSLSSINIPDSVTSIGSYAFRDCDGITSMLIPENVTTIGSCAFMLCSNLINVEIRGNVKTLESGLFSECTYLESVTLPNSFTNIGSTTFSGCSRIKDIYYCGTKQEWQNIHKPANTNLDLAQIHCQDGDIGVGWDLNEDGILTIYGTGTIIKHKWDTAAVKEIVIQYGPKYIDADVFSGFSNVTSVTIPNSVTSIGQSAFMNCTNLEDVKLSDNLKQIDTKVFLGCKKLENIVIPDSVTSIGYQAFSDCHGLKSIDIASGVKSIGEFAFFNCTGLESVSIPNSVNSIGVAAFSTCTSLKDIVIPSSVKKINELTFSNCSSLENITLSNGLVSIGYSAFEGCNSLKEIIIPSSVTSIAFTAFSKCVALSSVIIPHSISPLGSAVFENCTNLTDASLSKNLNAISAYTFSRCSSLGSINVPQKVSSIGEQAFYNCNNLEYIILPRSLKNIDKKAFKECNLLGDVYFEGTKEEWQSIKIADENDPLFNATVHYNYVPPEKVRIDRERLTIGVGEQYEIECELYPANSTAISISYATEDSGIAEVNEDGVITGIGPGKTEVTVTVDGEKSAKIGVDVIRRLEALDIEKAEVQIESGSNYQLGIVTTPIDATEKLIYTSDNERVATVDANGLVTALSVGEATITIQSSDTSNVSTTCKVVVIKKVTALDILNYRVSLTVGHAQNLEVIVKPEDASNKELIWSSTDPDIAEVDNNGRVTAKRIGTTEIFATTTDGSNIIDSCYVAVGQPVTKVTLNKTDTSIRLELSETLIATVEPNTAMTKTVTWKSSNTSVATVDSTGTVTAVSPGYAIITATAMDGSGCSATCDVTVEEPVIYIDLNIRNNEIKLPIGERLTFEPTVYPENATNKTLTWVSNHPQVASVDENGTVVALSKGKATIIAVSADGIIESMPCRITVIQPATGITLDKSSISILAGKSTALEATILPSDASEQEVIWHSKNEDIATVDNAGLITAVKPGITEIEASSADNAEVKASCEVTVTQPVTELTLDATEATLIVGDVESLTAVVSPSDAFDNTVIWECSNESIAIIDNTGKVTAVSPGTVTITATAADGSGKSATCVVTVIEKIETNEMYRLYNPKSGEHFYTSNAYEKNQLVKRGPWKYEGIAWNAPVESDYPVYRMYNPRSKAHHYTMDENERDVLCGMGKYKGKGKGWNYEGIGWYSAIDAKSYNMLSNAEKAQYIPLHRLYNPRYPMVSAHHYTADTNEIRVLTTQKGWKYEGIAWYGAR